MYIRIPTSALPTVQLRHLVSKKDSTIALPPGAPGSTATGITEWVGSWQNKVVSLGWDWGVVGGVVVVLSQHEIRTNVQLIAADGGPAPRAIAQIHLFHWIESLPWREIALSNLLERQPELRESRAQFGRKPRGVMLHRGTPG